MKKPGLYFLAGVLSVFAVVGALGLFLLILEKVLEASFRGSSASDIVIKANIASPNQEYMATSYIDAGGGAAGWCEAKVNLRKKEEPFDSKKDYVFSTHCTSDIEVTWQNDKNLLIKYTTDEGSASLYQKSWSSDKGVKISYRAK